MASVTDRLKPPAPRASLLKGSTLLHRMKLSATQRLCVFVCAATASAVVGGAASEAAQADTAVYVGPEAVTDVLEGANHGAIVGDAVLASAGGSDITIPAAIDSPLIIESGEITAEVTLPDVGEVSSEVDAETASVVHTSADGTTVIPLAREDGVLQILSVIADSASAAPFTYGIDATGLVSMEPMTDGGVVGVDAAGDSVFEVAAPWALDALGSPVPTTFEVLDGKLVQHVDTTGLTESRYPVVADIGVNASASVSGTVSWTSAKAPVGSSFKAWAVGKKVTYKIEKYKVSKAGGRTISKLVETSPTLTAFEPVKGFAVGQ